MSSGMKTIIYPVRDLDAAKKVFGALLGAEPTSDAPYYVGYSIDGQEIGLDPNGHAQGQNGPVAFSHVTDLAATLEQLIAAGATLQRPTKDVGYGRLIATVVDPDGNELGLLQDS